MRRVAFSLFLLLSGCAGHKNLKFSEPPPATLPGVVRLISRYMVASACATTEGVFTAGHVVNPWAGDYQALGHLEPLAWTAGGYEGIAMPVFDDPVRDIARLELVPEPPLVTASRATQEPVEGDDVWWVEYDYGTPQQMLASRIHRAHFVRRVAAHLVLDEAPVEGASGGCLFNRAGEVIGIVVWSVDTKDFKRAGVAVALVP